MKETLPEVDVAWLSSFLDKKDCGPPSNSFSTEVLAREMLIEITPEDLVRVMDREVQLRVILEGKIVFTQM